MTDNEILDFPVATTTVGAMGAMEFLQWVAKKLNELPSFKGAVVELRALVSNPPLARTMSDEEKIKIVRKLLSVAQTL